MRANKNLGWASAWAALALLALWACHLGPEDGKDKFALVGDTTWLACDTVLVVLRNEDGEAVDTLFNGPLESLDELRKLDAEAYDGGKGSILVRGAKDGGLCFEQTRRFEEGGSGVKVDTLRDPNVLPTQILVQDGLNLTLGQSPPNLIAAIKPAYADPTLIWSVEPAGVVSFEGLQDGRGNPARVKPLKVGTAVVTVRSAKDTSVSARVDVRVTSTAGAVIDIKATGDTVLLFENGVAESLAVEVPAEYRGETVRWSTAHNDVAEVDAQGRIRPVKAGETSVKATLDPSGLSDEAVVVVRKDVPVVTVESAPGAPVNAEIVFTVKASQRYGSITLFRWDLDGDGKYDDSSEVDLAGEEVTLPAKKASYSQEGQVTVRFLVRDSEGNEGVGEKTLDIGNQAPIITRIRKDTTISVKDEIALRATARDEDGKLSWVGWDYENDGRFDDTLAVTDQETAFDKVHRFVEAGTYVAIFKAVDQNGKARTDTSRVRVELDAPTADAGADSSLEAGKPFVLSMKGQDKFGSIAKREFRCGADTVFRSVSQQDTSLVAPSQAGPYKCVVRVTDDDGLSATDEVVYTVVLSSNAELTELVLSAGSLAPTFRPNAVTYEGRVAFSDSLITVTPKARDGSTEILVNGKPVASGSASAPVRLHVGRNNWVGRAEPNQPAFTILVTAADGSQRTYLVNMTREPNGEATLARLEAANLSFTPAFAPGTLEYADTVTFDVAAVNFKPTVASAGATLAFNDSAMTSGNFTGSRALEFGENVFRFNVTAMDGETSTLYTVRVFRLGRIYAYRKIGAAAAVIHDSADVIVGNAYPLGSGLTPALRFLKWSVLKGTADFADSLAYQTTITPKSGVVEFQGAFELNRYTVKVTASGCGSIKPSGDITVNHGDNLPFEMSLPAGTNGSSGCRVKSAKVDGVEDTSAYDGKFGFLNVTANHTLDLVFARTYTLTAAATGRGTVSPTSAVIDSGTANVTLQFTPQANYKVARGGLCDRGACNLSPTPQNTFVIPKMEQNHEFTVQFVRFYRMTGSISSGQGTISPADSIVDSLSTVVWRFSPAANYRFDTLYVDNGVTQPSDNGVYVWNGANANRAVRVAFRRQYSLTIQEGPGGSVNQKSGSVDSNASVTFTATPLTGYRVDSVLVDGTPVTTTGKSIWDPQTWTVGPFTTKMSVRVTYKRFYQIVVKNGTGGQLTPAQTNVDSGASQVYSIVPETGYRLTALNFEGTDVMGGVSGLTYTFKDVTKDGTLVPTFTINSYTITVRGIDLQVSSPGGKWFPLGDGSEGTLKGTHGTVYAIATAKVNQAGVPFSRWTTSRLGSADGNPLVITLTGDITWTAEYGRIFIDDRFLSPTEASAP